MSAQAVDKLLEEIASHQVSPEPAKLISKAYVAGFVAGYFERARSWRYGVLPRAGIFAVAVAVLACLIWWVA